MAVQVEDSNHLVLGVLLGPLHVADEAQRRAQDVADAKRNCAHVLARVGAVLEVLDNPLRARGEDALGDLPAGLERPARQGHPPLGASQLEVEPALVVGEHDEAALGARDVDRRVEHQCQHVVEHPSGPECAQPFEQTRHVAQSGCGRERGAGARDVRVADEKDNLGVVRLAQADQVAMRQHVFGRAFPIDECAELGLAIAQPAHLIVHDDLRVVPGHPIVDHPHVASGVAAERDERLIHGDLPSAVRVGDDQPRIRVAHAGLAFSTTIRPTSRKLPPKRKPSRRASVVAGQNWPPWTNTAVHGEITVR